MAGNCKLYREDISLCVFTDKRVVFAESEESLQFNMTIL